MYVLHSGAISARLKPSFSLQRRRSAGLPSAAGEAAWGRTAYSMTGSPPPYSSRTSCSSGGSGNGSKQVCDTLGIASPCRCTAACVSVSWCSDCPCRPSACQPASQLAGGPHLQHVCRQLAKAGEIIHQALEALQLVALLGKKPVARVAWRRQERIDRTIDSWQARGQTSRHKGSQSTSAAKAATQLDDHAAAPMLAAASRAPPDAFQHLLPLLLPAAAPVRAAVAPARKGRQPVPGPRQLVHAARVQVCL